MQDAIEKELQVTETTGYRANRLNKPRLSTDRGVSALHFIADAEERVAKQKQLIGRLRKADRSTKSAETVLKTFERTLLGLQTYHQLMQILTDETKS
jgi:hypothetical protein